MGFLDSPLIIVPVVLPGSMVNCDLGITPYSMDFDMCTTPQPETYWLRAYSEFMHDLAYFSFPAIPRTVELVGKIVLETFICWSSRDE